MMRNERQAAGQAREKTQRTPNERLKAHRLKKNWTQVYVATMIGTNDVEVSRWETDIVSISKGGAQNTGHERLPTRTHRSSGHEGAGLGGTQPHELPEHCQR